MTDNPCARGRRSWESIWQRSSRPKWLRKGILSLFVSNLLGKISKPELATMFARAGRIVDVFIPIDKVFGLNWGLDLFGLHPRDRQI